MAYVGHVKAFDSEYDFRVGERVKVIVDGIAKKDIACNTGLICGISVNFIHTPEMRQIKIRVRMDAPYFKKTVFGEMGEFVTLNACQIEKIKGV